MESEQLHDVIRALVFQMKRFATKGCGHFPSVERMEAAPARDLPGNPTFARKGFFYLIVKVPKSSLVIEIRN